MKAVVYDAFSQPLTVRTVPDPAPPDGGVIICVKATGICRSDWHGWMGHDAGIRLPHVPGHETAGVIRAVGAGVRRWRVGDRVTLPFQCACGACRQCVRGDHQVCDRPSQPGFSRWGAFAEYLAVEYADVNLVRLPDEVQFVAAAALGCRFATSFRALLDQARLCAGEWLAVHGCGGVGLSAIMIADALGANVVAIDISDEKLSFARSLGAQASINAANEDVVEAVRALTGGGAHVSIDALGSSATCFNSVANLRKRGRHVQVGLLLGQHSRPALPMDKVVAEELELYGSHGMQAHRYPAILTMMRAGKLSPQKMVSKRIELAQAPRELVALGSFAGVGITVIDRFRQA